MKTSLEIRNDIKAARDMLGNAAALAASDDSTVADKAREDMFRLGGRIDAMEEQLDAALAEEAAMRADGCVPLVRRDAEKRQTVAAKVLGPKNAFSGFDLGRTVSVHMGSLSVDVGELGTPVQTDTSLPTYDLTGLSPFIATLRQGSCDGDVRYMRAAKLDNKAAAWKRSGGTQKPKSDVVWTPASAALQTVAHWIPVAKQSARRYRDLETAINNELMDGLHMACDAVALNGEDSSGITGVLKDSGIQTYTAKSGDSINDHVRRMITKSLVATGISPDHVVMHPFVKESMDLAKDDNNQYLFVTINGTSWGIPIVEDVNLATTTGEKTDYGMLAYWGGAATWLTADSAEVTVGLIDKQLIENSYTLLAESSHALKVVYPQSFVHMASVLTVE